jgi:hypothetical protein
MTLIPERYGISDMVILTDTSASGYADSSELSERCIVTAVEMRCIVTIPPIVVIRQIDNHVDIRNPWHGGGDLVHRVTPFGHSRTIPGPVRYGPIAHNNNRICVYVNTRYRAISAHLRTGSLYRPVFQHREY